MEVISWSELTRRARIPSQTNLRSSVQGKKTKNPWSEQLCVLPLKCPPLTFPKHLKRFLGRFDFNLHTTGNIHVVVLVLSENFRLRRPMWGEREGGRSISLTTHQIARHIRVQENTAGRGGQTKHCRCFKDIGALEAWQKTSSRAATSDGKNAIAGDVFIACAS